jgi:hypothetical protein
MDICDILKQNLKDNDITTANLIIDSLNDSYLGRFTITHDNSPDSLIVKQIQKAHTYLLDGAIEYHNAQFFKLAQRLTMTGLGRSIKDLFNEVIDKIEEHKAYDLIAPTVLLGLFGMSEITKSVIENNYLDMAQYIIDSTMLDFDRLTFQLHYPQLFSQTGTDQLIKLFVQHCEMSDFAFEKAFSESFKYQNSQRLTYLVEHYPEQIKEKLEDWRIYIEQRNYKTEFDHQNIIAQIEVHQGHIQIFSTAIELFQQHFNDVNLELYIEYFTLAFKKQSEPLAYANSIALVDAVFEKNNMPVPQSLLSYLEKDNRHLDPGEYQTLTQFSKEYEKAQIKKQKEQLEKNMSQNSTLSSGQKLKI